MWAGMLLKATAVKQEISWLSSGGLTTLLTDNDSLHEKSASACEVLRASGHYMKEVVS